MEMADYINGVMREKFSSSVWYEDMITLYKDFFQDMETMIISTD